MKKRIKHWLIRSKVNIIISLYAGLIFTGTSLTIQKNVNHAFLQIIILFLFFTFGTFFLFNFVLKTNLYYYLKVIKRFDEIRKQLKKNNIELPYFDIVTIKLESVNTIYMKRTMSMKFMNSNYYDENTEYAKMTDIVIDTISDYQEQWRICNIESSLTKQFELIHNVNIVPFLSELKQIIYYENNLFIRRKKVFISLLNIIDATINDYTKLIHNAGVKYDKEHP